MINDASLVMIPSGYKDGKLYSVKPTDGSGDFTFSRGSNLAATRVNSEGLIEKGRENLLLQSNTFDTTWVRYLTTLTSGQSGYDGSNDAWLLNKSASGFANISQSVSTSGVLTASVYAKAGTNSNMILRCLGSTDAQGFFNLSNGTIASSSVNCIDTQINAVGNGWYRCSITLNTSSTSYVLIYPEYPFGGTTAGNIYIQDAQLEAGLVATDYIETTTTTAQAGILEDMPRLNYGTCPSLLLEPQRTNLLTNSEYFTDFSLAGGILTANDTTSPEGVSNAYKFTEDVANSQHRLRKDFSVSSGNHTISVFVKGTSRFLSIYPQTAATAYAVFDLQNETITKTGGTNYVSSSIENYVNDWYRIILTCTTSASTLKVHFYLSNSGTSEAPTYIGDGNSHLHFYGAMVEQGSYPTSYIPTYGASVTRGADDCYSSTNADVDGSHTYIIDFEFTNTSDEMQLLHLYNTTDTKGVTVTINAFGNSGVIGMRGRNSGSDFGIASFSGCTANTKYTLQFDVNYTSSTITNATLNNNSPDGGVSARIDLTTNGLYLGSRVDSYFLNGEITKFVIL